MNAEQLRKTVSTLADEELGRFMHGYALGHVLELLFCSMHPEQRVAALTIFRQSFPEAWERAAGGAS